MSLETTISSLVKAANDLTGVVSGKIGQIDTRMDQARAEFDQFRALKDVVGVPGLSGTLLMSVLQGSIWGTGGVYGVGASGDFPATNLGASDNVYVHFKLPFTINLHDQMFWLNIRGYSYGSVQIIDETFTGYCYAPQRKVLNQACFGNFTPTIYTDSNGYVVCRLKLPSCYVTSMRIDTMKIGTYNEIKVGDIKVKLSLSDTVVF